MYRDDGLLILKNINSRDTGVLNNDILTKKNLEAQMYKYILDDNRSFLSKYYYALSLKEQNRTQNIE